LQLRKSHAHFANKYYVFIQNKKFKNIISFNIICCERGRNGTVNQDTEKDSAPTTSPTSYLLRCDHESFQHSASLHRPRYGQLIISISIINFATFLVSSLSSVTHMSLFGASYH